MFTAVQGQGTGWVAINGDLRMMTSGQLTMIGARTGINGTLDAFNVEHTYIRRGRFVTGIDDKTPNIEAAGSIVES